MTARRPADWLVTGGTGFIGSALVRRLVREGRRVRVLDDGSRGSARRLDPIAREIEIVSGDVRDPATVRRACEGVEGVCHLAAVNGTRFFYSMPERVLEVAVKGTVNVIDAAIAEGVAELFVASSSEVYQKAPTVPTDETVPLSIPDPLNPRYSYAGGKIVSELLALNYGRRHFRRVIVFRPHNVYGPDMGWEHVVPQLILRVLDLASTHPDDLAVPIEGTGRETRAFVYIDDCVDAIWCLLARGKHLGIYHIGSDEEVTIERLAIEIGKCLGRDITVVPGPRPAGSTPRRAPDITKIGALGYHPLVSLRKGLERTIPWYAEHAGEAPAGTELTGV